MEMEPLFDLGPYQDESKLKNTETDTLTIYLGVEAATAVVQAIGGLTLRVPSSASGERWEFLEKKLGVELAQLLIDKFSGEELYIPKKHQSDINEKHRRVRERYEELRKTHSNIRSIHELAREMGLSDRHIRRILDPPT